MTPPESADSPSTSAASADAEVAARIWREIRALVLDDELRKEVAETLGVSFVRARALRRLAAGPLTMRSLAEQMSTDPPYTTLIVDDLEQRGFVERTVNPSDRRSKIVALTPAGTRAARKAERILDRPMLSLLRLESAELASLEQIMTKLREGR